jgi:hypothetical protein
MKNCPNCGSPIDPYRVKCEYCETMYFDWATWLQDGQPCFINYKFDYGYNKGTITTQAIPHLEQIEINDEPTYITIGSRDNVIKYIRNNRYCDLHVVFTCVADQKDKSLCKVIVEE